MSFKPATPQAEQGPNLFSLVILTGLMGWLTLQLGPVMLHGQIQPLPAMTGFIAAIGGLKLLAAALNLVARFLDWRSSHTPSGKEGTARWGKVKDIKDKLNPDKTGPFWGRTVIGKIKDLFVDYASVALTLGPAGSGKGIYTVITNILSIRHSKVVADFKGELVCILKAVLQARGEVVRVLNPGGLWQKIIGLSDQYNPIDVITDSLYTPGCLRDVCDDLREMGEQIYPEPEAEGENKFFRGGGRDCLGLAIGIEAMIEGYDALISNVALLIEDRRMLEDNLCWVVGVDVEGKPLPDGPMPIEQTEWAQLHDPQEVAEFAKLFRARCSNLLALMTTTDSRTFDSFIMGAKQCIAPFAFGRLATVMGRSTFSMKDLKGEVPTTLFIVLDSRRPQTSNTYNALIQWCALRAMKHHEDIKKPVYFILDESSNAKIFDLVNLLTYSRGYGIRLHLFLQDIFAFERVYGKPALKTLISQSEIIQILPGTVLTETLELIEKLLGKQSVMMAGLSSQGLGSGLHEHMSESGRSLMTSDEIRTSEHGLLIMQKQHPVLIEPVSYAEIEPWRSQVDTNPFHGEPFLEKVKIRLAT